MLGRNLERKGFLGKRLRKTAHPDILIFDCSWVKKRFFENGKLWLCGKWKKGFSQNSPAARMLVKPVSGKTGFSKTALCNAICCIYARFYAAKRQ